MPQHKWVLEGMFVMGISLLSFSHFAQAALPIAQQSISDSLQVHAHQCQRDREFIHENDRATYPITALWSFPGSGNTYTRLLLEYGSGYHTGSIYSDRVLSAMGMVEDRNDSSVIAVKGHWLNREGKLEGGSPFSYPHGMQRAVIMVRNPLEALWSEAQRSPRWRGELGQAKSHTNTLTLDYLEDHWAQFRSFMLRAAQCWTRMHASAVHFMDEKSPIGRYAILVRYEDLLAHPEEELRRMLHFLLTPLNETPEKQNIACALLLANNPKVKRVGLTVHDVFMNTRQGNELRNEICGRVFDFAAIFGYAAQLLRAGCQL